MGFKTLRRGKATDVAFMLTHTVLISRQGRKLPCQVDQARKAFLDNPKARLIETGEGHGVMYQFAVGDDIYEMFSQRL